MASMNVSVPEPMRDWVNQRLESGKYASVNDYVRDRIRRDHEQTEKEQAMIAALIAGEQSGISKHRIPEILAAVQRELQRHGGRVATFYRKPPTPIFCI